MTEQSYVVSSDHLDRWLEELSGPREVFFPRKIDGDWKYGGYSGEPQRKYLPSPYRPVESLKSFLFPERTLVARFPHPLSGNPDQKKVIAGLKACDLACLPVLDYIFQQGDFSDPFYRETREKTLLLSQDCTGFKEVCFCPVVGGQPYPVKGFDLNLSPLSGGYLVAVGSEKGKNLIEESPAYFKEAGPEQVDKRDKLREKVLADLKKQLREQGQIEAAPTAAEVKVKSGDKLWKEESVPCVECGACNLVCPTCHCFILEEMSAASGSLRLRNWDSCQYPGFSRVAGGANPRPRRSERLSNRFSKKFQFFPEVVGVIACTGCGRCFEACMGKIDIRKILKRIKGG